MNRLLRYKALLIILLLLAGWSAFLILVPPDALIKQIGVANSYLFAFLISLVAGFSTFTGSAAYASVIQLTQGGANPLYLGLAAGIGLFLSDSAFYFLAMKGRDAIQARLSAWFNHIRRIVSRVPDMYVYLGAFLFCATGPIPNDLILGVLVVAGYRYRSFWPAIFLGDIVFMLSLSYLFR